MIAAVDLPLGAPPRPSAQGRAVHGRVPVEHYRLPEVWCLHRYTYACDLRVGDTDYAIRPGDLTLVPPDTPLRYTYPQPECRHHYALFRLDRTDPSVPVAVHLRVDPAADISIRRVFDAVVDGGRGPEGVAALWHLLWVIAGCAASARSMEDLVAARIDERLGEELSVPALAAEVGLSADHLTRRFRLRHGSTVVAWIRERRLLLARRLLEEGMPPVQAARTCGLADLQYFNKLLRQRFGRSPRDLQPAKRRPAGD